MFLPATYHLADASFPLALFGPWPVTPPPPHLYENTNVADPDPDPCIRIRDHFYHILKLDTEPIQVNTTKFFQTQ